MQVTASDYTVEIPLTEKQINLLNNYKVETSLEELMNGVILVESQKTDTPGLRLRNNLISYIERILESKFRAEQNLH
jgi:hypothetical protein